MIKQIMTMSGVAGILLTAGPMMASAASVRSAGTTGNVTFTAPSKITNPKDPTNLGTDIVPDNGTINTNPGAITLDFAPNLNFDSHEISNGAKSFKAKDLTFKDGEGKTQSRANYVQVTDNRGTFDGWNLTATAGKFTSDLPDTNVAKTLTNATIDINGNSIVGTGSVKATNMSDIALRTDSTETNIMGADVNTGDGSNLGVYGTSGNGPVLRVPEASAVAATSYTSTIIYTLSDAPDSMLP